MLRRELCMWKTGMRIRYNISCLEEWARKMKMVCTLSLHDVIFLKFVEFENQTFHGNQLKMLIFSPFHRVMK